MLEPLELKFPNASTTSAADLSLLQPAKEKGMQFNHFDESGNAVMVDVSHKQPTLRTAIAEASVHMSAELLAAIRSGGVAKGDVLGVARLSGIMAAKKTPELIPLSHPLAIHNVTVDFEEDATGS